VKAPVRKRARILESDEEDENSGVAVPTTSPGKQKDVATPPKASAQRLEKVSEVYLDFFQE